MQIGYAALALLLFFLQGSNSNASGNIGCLFSETLCSQEKEWCFDDYAFGRCLPLYGNIKEDNLYRYELGTGELHLLERQMQKLFLLGYRWSHTYTQCVLQLLLDSIRDRIEFDASPCNVELDQDLEGALKAIEGEELEQVDPRNLAIVRFTPSMLNPNSDYADELYYPPPIGELLPEYKPPKDQRGQQQTPLHNFDKGHKNSKQSSLTDFIEAKGKEENETKPKFPHRPHEDGPLTVAINNMIKPSSLNNDIQLPIGLPDYSPAADYAFSDEYENDMPYGPPYEALPIVEPMFKKRSEYYGNRITAPMETTHGFVPQELLGKKANMKFNYLRNLVEGRSPQNMRERLSDSMPDKPLFLDVENPGKAFGVLRNDKKFPMQPQEPYEQQHHPFEPAYAFGVLRQNPHHPPMLGPYTGPFVRNENLPELDPPNPEHDFPETIHPKYDSQEHNDKDASRYPYNMQHGGDYFDDIGSPINSGNSISRFDENGQPNMKEQYPLYPKGGEAQDYQKDIPKDETADHFQDQGPHNHFNGFKSGYDTDFNAQGISYPQELLQNTHGYPPPPPPPQQAFPPQYYYDQYPTAGFYNYPDFTDYGLFPPVPFDPKFVKKDEEEVDGDYFAHHRNPHWNLPRNERQDVKKPGPNPPFPEFDARYPFYRDSHYNPFGHYYPVYQDAQVHGGSPDLQPDMVESEHSYVDDVGDMAGTKPEHLKGHGFEKQIPLGYYVTEYGRESIPQPEDEPVATPPPPEYVHVHIGEKFENHKEAKQMLDIILRAVNLNFSNIEDFSVEENAVKFQIKQSKDGITSALIAERIEEERDKIKRKTGKDIIQTGVGPKGSMTAVVYSSDEYLLRAVAIVCGVCAAVVIAALAVFFLKRHSSSKAKLQGLISQDTEASEDYQNLCRQMSGKGHVKEKGGSGSGHPVATHGSTHAPGQRISSLSKESDNGNNSPSSRSSTSSWSEEPVMSNMDISTGHMVLSYMEDHLRNKDRLDQEWLDLCAYEAEPDTCNVALKNENKRKNRYAEAVPYDHNRVILNEHTNVSGSNYINASSITDHDPRNPAYIATQGPLASTAPDFWQLVWEQGSVVIVMLTRLSENDQALSHRYWPEEGSELYHIYEVHLVSEHIWCDDYLVRSFYLKNVRTGETRTVTQFHFLSWTDSGVPASTKALLEFRRKVNKSYRGRSCPIIVHCSDGVGRTGTYCLIDMVLNRMAKGAKEIDIAATLEHIRDQRPDMVKTKLQFEFVLMAVAEEVHAILKALPQ